MRFDDVADELYAVPREEFTALRKQRAAEARASGERELAGEIGGLRKPTTAAWLVNQLSRQHAEEVAGLERLAEALRMAHAELAGDDLRELSRQRSSIMHALLERARQLGADHEVPVSDAVARDITGTLEAALVDPETARDMARGRLESAPDPGLATSIEWLAAAEGASAGPTRAKPERSYKRDSTATGAAQARRNRTEAQQRRRAELAEAREVLRAAMTDRDKAERELARAEHAEQEARRAATAARAKADKASRVVTDAEEAVTKLEQ